MAQQVSYVRLYTSLQCQLINIWRDGLQHQFAKFLTVITSPQFAPSVDKKFILGPIQPVHPTSAQQDKDKADMVQVSLFSPQNYVLPPFFRHPSIPSTKVHLDVQECHKNSGPYPSPRTGSEIHMYELRNHDLGIYSEESALFIQLQITLQLLIGRFNLKNIQKLQESNSS